MSTIDSAGLDTGALDQLLGGAVESGALPGVAALVSSRDGVVYEGGFGRLDATDPGSPAVGTDTVFRMASMTKAMASVAALQLVEEGRLALDTPVQDILPEFAELQVLTGFDGDEPQLRAPARPPVIQDLLTHTSGCGYFFSNEKLLQWHGVTGKPHVLTGLREGVFTPLVHDPGTMWEYGVSTDALGLVVDAVTGSTLDAVLRERVFGPLGMHEATFRPTEEQTARTMRIHARQEDGSLALSPIDLVPDPEYMAGGHGSYATARDHGRFLQALLRGGELDGARILRPETVELMFTDHIAGIAQPENGITSAAPELSNDVPPLPIRTGWGLGLSLRHEQIPGMRAAGSGDWAGLFNCYYWIDRETGISAALLTQVLPFFDEQIVTTLLGFELALYAALG
ncbi:MAG: serine hydrolase [Solirubrobacterales bacterium]|nr:serine hydrolase [Solirubrobacterales bacterium]